MKRSKDPRHNARKMILCLLYSYNIENKVVNDLELTIDLVIEALEIKHFDENLYTKLFPEILDNIDNINKEINSFSVEWNTENFFKTDLAILQLSLFELKNINTPYKVVIDEAIELAKEFSTDLSSKFINGLLASIADKVVKN